VFQEVKVPRFQDSRHMKVVRLSALRTGDCKVKFDEYEMSEFVHVSQCAVVTGPQTA